MYVYCYTSVIIVLLLLLSYYCYHSTDGCGTADGSKEAIFIVRLLLLLDYISLDYLSPCYYCWIILIVELLLLLLRLLLLLTLTLVLSISIVILIMIGGPRRLPNIWRPSSKIMNIISETELTN